MLHAVRATALVAVVQVLVVDARLLDELALVFVATHTLVVDARLLDQPVVPLQHQVQVRDHHERFRVETEGQVQGKVQLQLQLSAQALELHREVCSGFCKLAS